MRISNSSTAPALLLRAQDHAADRGDQKNDRDDLEGEQVIAVDARDRSGAGDRDVARCERDRDGVARAQRAGEAVACGRVPLGIRVGLEAIGASGGGDRETQLAELRRKERADLRIDAAQGEDGSQRLKRQIESCG